METSKLNSIAFWLFPSVWPDYFQSEKQTRSGFLWFTDLSLPLYPLSHSPFYPPESGTEEGKLTTLSSNHFDTSSPSCWQSAYIGSSFIRRQIGRVMTPWSLVVLRKLSRSARSFRMMAFSQ